MIFSLFHQPRFLSDSANRRSNPFQRSAVGLLNLSCTFLAHKIILKDFLLVQRKHLEDHFNFLTLFLLLIPFFETFLCPFIFNLHHRRIINIRCLSRHLRRCAHPKIINLVINHLREPPQNTWMMLELPILAPRHFKCFDHTIFNFISQNRIISRAPFRSYDQNIVVLGETFVNPLIPILYAHGFFSPRIASINVCIVRQTTSFWFSSQAISIFIICSHFTSA